jgi:hypothetical protein
MLKCNSEPAMADVNQPKTQTLEQIVRPWLTFVIVSLSVLGIFLLCVVVIWLAPTDQKLETAKLVFTAALPLLASWVGTILSHYFSKENVAAATESIARLAEVSGIEKLRKIPAKDTMRPLRDIKLLKVPAGSEDQFKLTDLLTHFAQVDRMLLVESETNPVVNWLVYKALVNEYISATARQAKPLPAGRTGVADLTLQDLVSNADKKEMFKSSFGFVRESATLAEAKARMDAVPQCRDVFVTPTGSPKEGIVGWVTDNRIIENSRVD